MKVKALLKWADQNTVAGKSKFKYSIASEVTCVIQLPTGANRQKVLQPVLKNIQLQFISAQDLMKVTISL